MSRNISVNIKDGLNANFERNENGINLVSVTLHEDELEDFGALKFGEPITKAIEAAEELIECFLESVVPFKSYPLDQTTRWSFTSSDGNALLGRNGENWGKFKAAHTIVKGGGTPKNKGAYALPHHKIKGGQVTTFWSGVRAARQRLSAVSGVSDAERQGAARHLARHYREFGKTPPASLAELAGQSYADANSVIAMMKLRSAARRLSV
ncbi:MAG: hypothetical protein GWN14_05295 [candidate division Zixibacteria bacterium]|nr:hypothetical protein [candidate division Zixibacteria bacterium]